MDILQFHNMTRGQKEPALLIQDNFIWGTMTEGCWKGCPFCKLKSSHKGQKQKQLTLSSHTRKDTTKKSNYLPLVKMTDNWFNEYNIVPRWFFNILPPNSESTTPYPIRIFQHMASQKQLKVSVEYLIYCSTLWPAVFYSILFYSILVSNYNCFFFHFCYILLYTCRSGNNKVICGRLHQE